MHDVVAQLLHIRDRALALNDLSPGKGYDSLGFAFCDLVMNTRADLQQRTNLFSMLYDACPQALGDLQNISVQSEICLEHYHARILLEDMQGKKPTSLNEAFSSYPYAWIGRRPHYEKQLLESLPDYNERKHNGSIIILGKSILPFSALNMHMNTGMPVMVIDRYQDGVHVAEKVIDLLVENGLIADEKVSVRHAQTVTKDDLAQAYALFVQDDEWWTDEVIDLVRSCHIPVMRVEPRGLARLMYPDTRMICATFPLHTRHAVALSRLAADEPEQALHIIHMDGDGLFVSLALYKPL